MMAAGDAETFWMDDSIRFKTRIRMSLQHTYQLAQLNIACLKYPMDDPRMGSFLNQVDSVNNSAKAAPGFVWMQTDGDSAEESSVFGPKYLVNLSVWSNIKTLRDFTFGQPHLDVLKARTEWFDRMKSPHLVLWWILEGQFPSMAEARNRLLYLEQNGPSPVAFGWAGEFEPAATEVVNGSPTTTFARGVNGT